ncbi:hypothetical protein WMY93_000121 [Mugilogobius chulae]|uniref:Uncharacterized protein n=1 Tax=Mugilogobius chulae TaxID=88201 RepID=A0AAW0PZD5_9GOBI
MAFDNEAFEDFCVDFSQEPFTVFWTQPFDIEAAFNRLSTIFECEEELAKSRESVLSDENTSAPAQFTFQGEAKEGALVKKSKKFKLKFPKNKLAQISRAIRTGKTKKREETEARKLANGNKTSQGDKRQVNELCRNALDSIDSLEASIKQLEISVDSFGVASSPPAAPDLDLENKRATWGNQRDSQPPQRKRAKAGRGEQVRTLPLVEGRWNCSFAMESRVVSLLFSSLSVVFWFDCRSFLKI